ncbi:MAG: bifunctional 5,10-methylenetetrahydrofolate dehydrogenase/5,10-methenyltetrahydrofolate cyclohydrolase [Promethearchaeota archaeon]
MKDKILDGKYLADKLNAELKDKITKAVKKTGIIPKLITILVGMDSASKIYVNNKHKACQEVGIESKIIELDENISKDELMDEISKANNDPTTHAILLQLPLPKKIREHTNDFIEEILSSKDADGLHPLNRGKLFDYNEELAACTPKGIIKLLEYYNVEIKGKDVVIINRSNLVGKPLIFMLLKRNATVTICHTSTKDINEYIRKADILITAVRQPNFITKNKIKEGVIIIDVSMNRVEGKLCGDVDFENVLEKCQKITPVPGGVGPMTVAMLCENTFAAYKKQVNLS